MADAHLDGGKVKKVIVEISCRGRDYGGTAVLGISGRQTEGWRSGRYCFGRFVMMSEANIEE